MDVLFIAISYLVGAMPTGYIIARLAGIRDIRLHGSGSTGATNVARIVGKPYFFLILFLDAIKAYICLSIVSYSMVPLWGIYASALGLLLGNCWSIFLRSSSGKGVATSLGILCALAPMVALVLLGIWASVLCVTRTIGVASAITIIAFPLSIWYSAPTDYLLCILACSMCMIMLWRHKTNIQLYSTMWLG